MSVFRLTVIYEYSLRKLSILFLRLLVFIIVGKNHSRNVCCGCGSYTVCHEPLKSINTFVQVDLCGVTIAMYIVSISEYLDYILCDCQ